VGHRVVTAPRAQPRQFNDRVTGRKVNDSADTNCFLFQVNVSDGRADVADGGLDRELSKCRIPMKSMKVCFRTGYFGW
jgi:hypothetical protein